MKNKRIFFVLLAFVFVLIAAVCVLIYSGSAKKNDLLMDVNLYFYNSADDTIVAENRSINKSDNINNIISSVEQAYRNGTKTPGLLMPFPEGVSFEITNNNADFDGVLDINITGDFDSLKEAQRLICIGSLVYTFTDISSVKDVRLFVDGKSVSELYGMHRELNRENTVNNPVISPEKIDRQNVVLYFLNEKGTALAPEERSIEVKQSQTLEYQIVEQLTLGPGNDSLKAAVPPSTKIKDIKTEEGICYVNLSGDFISSLSGDANTEKLTIYSIVNSLTELNTVNKVQFLIDGERISELKGHYDFSRTFERDESLIDGN